MLQKMKRIIILVLTISACNSNPKMTEQERIDSVAAQQRNHIDGRVSQNDSLRKACILTMVEADSIASVSKADDTLALKAIAKAKIARKILDSLNHLHDH